MATEADRILGEVLGELGLTVDDPERAYRQIATIVELLEAKNQAQTIEVSTTGTITERLCELGLRAINPNCYRKLRKEWKWLGDFYLPGEPFNTIITVKSFKAKERLLSSGTGNLLSPTIGYGLFNDVREWSRNRVASYVFRGFFGIYVPVQLFDKLSEEVRAQKNINGMPFMRSLENFIEEIRGAMVDGMVDPRRL
jgi:hypothetical protein